MSKLKYFLYEEQFNNINSPEVAYLLGLLWADGWVTSKGDTLGFQTLVHDALEYIPVFNETGNWNISSRSNTLNNKELYTFLICNKKDIANFIKWNYQHKSFSSTKTVLSAIPKHLHSHFFRGWSDGDGCFYYNEKLHARQFIMSGHYNQNWDCFSNFLNENNITCKIRRTHTKRGTSNSTLLVMGRENFIKLHNLFYESFPINKIGLVRKYNKSKQIVDSYPSQVVKN